MKRFNVKITLLLMWMSAPCIHATKLATVQIIDREVIMVTFIDGDIIFRDDAKGPSAYKTENDASENTTVLFEKSLDLANAVLTSNWKIYSNDDASYGSAGRSPKTCYRKSKIHAMGQYNWNMSSNDYNYETPMEHHIFLILPVALKKNATYTIAIDKKTETDKTSVELKFNIHQSRSEAIHVNIVGYTPLPVVRSADVYTWMGNGNARDYNTFVGNKVYLYHPETNTRKEVGKLEFWKENQKEVQHNFIQSPVWIADFNTKVPSGNYRIAIDGIGCSDQFEIRNDIFKAPFDASVRGFFYMRIGEDCMECVPVPRRPLYIPDVDPQNTKVYITTMHPYHPQWGSFSSGDYWDNPNHWKPYMKQGNPTNPRATGGHSDALDWDRHLGHVSIIYDMLLPFYLTGGKTLLDDDCGIRESGNGIPDLLDEARNEVDFWLNLRDGKGYSHGLTNPNSNNELFQAGTTTYAAWANAVNSSMLAYCYQLIEQKELEKQYLDSALVAFHYAANQPDQMLTKSQGMGDISVTGRDLKMTAAALLYNLTGEKQYEDMFNENCEVWSGSAIVADKYQFQIWGVAAYLVTKQPVNYPKLYGNIVSSLISEAHKKEADYIKSRPSRRGTDNDINWFHTSHNMHRTIIAHAITKDPVEKDFFLKALTMEADWGLGRNPLNIIQMTTATTPLEHKRSVVNIYTTGRNDGTPGMHPGHTPYLNAYDWGGNMVMGKPSFMTQKSFPSDVSLWPMGEIYFDTRYVYAHSEFTPQQTMRGKMALYSYLHAIAQQNENDSNFDGFIEIDEEIEGPVTGIPESHNKQSNGKFGITVFPNPALGVIRVLTDMDCTKEKAYKIYNMNGQLQIHTRSNTPETVIDVSHLSAGPYLIRIENEEYAACTKFTISR